MTDDSAVIRFIAFEGFQGGEHLSQIFHTTDGDPDGNDDREGEHNDAVAQPEG